MCISNVVVLHVDCTYKQYLYPLCVHFRKRMTTAASQMTMVIVILGITIGLLMHVGLNHMLIIVLCFDVQTLW